MLLNVVCTGNKLCVASLSSLVLDHTVPPCCWFVWPLLKTFLLHSFTNTDSPLMLNYFFFALLDSCMYVGDIESRAAAVLLAWEQRCNQPAGAGNQAAQAGQLPSCPLLTHDPLLVLRPQRETQLHRAGGQDQVFLHWIYVCSSIDVFLYLSY